MTDETREGGCGCGALRYRTHGAPMIVHACHCQDCQRETGTAFALNAVFEADRVERLSGEVDAVETPSESGKGQVIIRCPACRIAVWSHYAGTGQRAAFVRVGTFDRPDGIAPDVHIYTRSKQGWLALPENAVAFDGYYKPAEVWSELSRNRWRAMMAKPSIDAD